MVSVLVPVETKAGFDDLGLEAIEDLLAATVHGVSLALMTGEPETVVEAQAPLKELLEARERLLAASNHAVPTSLDSMLY